MTSTCPKYSSLLTIAPSQEEGIGLFKNKGKKPKTIAPSQEEEIGLFKNQRKEAKDYCTQSGRRDRPV